MNKYNLEFYFFPGCPYCNLVQESISRNNITVSYFNIMEDNDALSKLISDTGRKTVPVLYINGSPMHESADIINWINKYKEEL